jgi:hypothetical protein
MLDKVKWATVRTRFGLVFGLYLFLAMQVGVPAAFAAGPSGVDTATLGEVTAREKSSSIPRLVYRHSTNILVTFDQFSSI